MVCMVASHIINAHFEIQLSHNAETARILRVGDPLIIRCYFMIHVIVNHQKSKSDTRCNFMIFSNYASSIYSCLWCLKLGKSCLRMCHTLEP